MLLKCLVSRSNVLRLCFFFVVVVFSKNFTHAKTRAGKFNYVMDIDQLIATDCQKNDNY